MALMYHFGLGKDGEIRDRRQRSWNPVNVYHFFKNTIEYDQIYRPEEEFNTLNGISVSGYYQFTVNDDGILYWRRRSCWCLSCMEELMNGTFNWDAAHVVLGCESASSSIGIDDTNEEEGRQNVYDFEVCDCAKKSGPGAKQREARKNMEAVERNAMATKQAPGDWVLFDRYGDEEPIWLGRVIIDVK